MVFNFEEEREAQKWWTIVSSSLREVQKGRCQVPGGGTAPWRSCAPSAPFLAPGLGRPACPAWSGPRGTILIIVILMLFQIIGVRAPPAASGSGAVLPGRLEPSAGPLRGSVGSERRRTPCSEPFPRPACPGARRNSEGPVVVWLRVVEHPGGKEPARGRALGWEGSCSLGGRGEQPWRGWGAQSLLPSIRAAPRPQESSSHVLTGTAGCPLLPDLGEPLGWG